jgi:hypothetical protein
MALPLFTGGPKNSATNTSTRLSTSIANYHEFLIFSRMALGRHAAENFYATPARYELCFPYDQPGGGYEGNRECEQLAVSAACFRRGFSA